MTHIARHGKAHLVSVALSDYEYFYKYFYALLLRRSLDEIQVHHNVNFFQLNHSYPLVERGTVRVK